MSSWTVARLAVILWLSLSRGLCDQIVYPIVGTLFVHELDTEYFQQQFPSVKNNYDVDSTDPIVYRANLEGFPDLPRWLRYTQRSPSHKAYFYGSPTDPGKQVIEVTATNRQTFETVQRKVIFIIRPSTVMQIPFQAEFLIRNLDVEELLPAEAQLDFQTPLQDVWESQKMTVLNITSALDKGGRVPLPLPGHKEGVYIKVGSDAPFSKCLQESQDVQTRKSCETGVLPAISCHEEFARQFHIDWCNVSLITYVEPTPVQPPLDGSGIMDDGSEFNPPSESLEETYYLTDYLLTLLLPLLIALLLCAILSYIMCCRREGIEKRDAETSVIQLVHQQSVFANTEELRHMADNRNVPRPLSTLPMFNVRTGERISPRQTSEDSARVPLILSQH
uniref:Dystroglycan-type cadherin-like domain-containing protein n=1 Tax=Leptobrachium leishanense TaxID=445787 RepID=A0A8C5QWI2_9ANUR